MTVVDGLLVGGRMPAADRAARSRTCAIRSTVDPETGLPMAMEIRTSSDASLDPILEDLALRCVQLRMARAAGIDCRMPNT